MSEEDAGVHSGGESPPAPGCGSLPDDLIREVLVRLPPEPSSLPRASAVCKHWRRLLTDTKFLRLFCAHHRKPPLLGVFKYPRYNIAFSPLLDPPDRIPRERFSPGPCTRRGCVLDVRHGRVLFNTQTHLTVFDPITSQRGHVSIPPEIGRGGYVNGAVLCAAGDQDHVHGDGGCHSSPFKVVLVSMYGDDNRSVARVYSSATGTWGNPISTDAPYELRGDARKQPTLVGNALYWLSNTDGILEFDLDEQSLTVIEGPPIARSFHIENRKIIHAEDGAIGFAVLSYPHFRMWQRNVNVHGVATWAPWKTIAIPIIYGLPPQINGVQARLLGYDDDAEFLFFHLVDSVYLVQLKSTQYKKLYETSYARNLHFFPFNSFYTPGTAVAGGFNGAEMLRIG